MENRYFGLRHHLECQWYMVKLISDCPCNPQVLHCSYNYRTATCPSKNKNIQQQRKDHPNIMPQTCIPAIYIIKIAALVGDETPILIWLTMLWTAMVKYAKQR